MAHILLAEDDVQYRRLLERTLQRAGHTVTSVGDGGAAVAAATSAPLPDFALVDLLMPEKEGLQTLKELRGLRPAMPVVIMTGGGRGSSAGYLRAATMLGAFATLEKPFSINDLIRVVEDALRPPAP